MKMDLLKRWSLYFLKKTDLRRWSQMRNLDHEWDERTILMAKMIPAGSRVLEFGAARLVLKRHLADGCVYTPSDLVARSEDTLVCDLNRRPLPDFGSQDFLVFSGVLEYIFDLEALVRDLAPRTANFLVSYEPATGDDMGERVRYGWVNNYRLADFEKLFTDRGFQIAARAQWKSQAVYRFRKNQ